MSFGAVIGRFQVACLTKGHLHLLSTVSTKHNGQLIILVGDTDKQPDSKDPLPFYVRERMLRANFPKAHIAPIRDCRDDEQWSKQVDSILAAIAPRQRITLYGGRDSFIPQYTGAYAVETLEANQGTSGTDQRASWKEKFVDSEQFRAGMIHATMNRYPAVYPTVDMAVLFDDGRKVLLGRKAGETGWRFPGGFIDATDQTGQMAATRELYEETGVYIGSADWDFVAQVLIDDWRTAKTDTSVLTSLYVVRCGICPGPIAAGDDLEEVRFWPLVDLQEGQLVPEHEVLLQLLLEYLG